MARLPLPEPSELPDYLRDLHDGASDADWSTRHVARAFPPPPPCLGPYPTGSSSPCPPTTERPGARARLSPRVKELVRLRIATLNGCKTCKAARLAQDTVPEPQAAGIDVYTESPDY